MLISDLYSFVVALILIWLTKIAKRKLFPEIEQTSKKVADFGTIRPNNAWLVLPTPSTTEVRSPGTGQISLLSGCTDAKMVAQWMVKPVRTVTSRIQIVESRVQQTQKRHDVWWQPWYVISVLYNQGYEWLVENLDFSQVSSFMTNVSWRAAPNLDAHNERPWKRYASQSQINGKVAPNFW